VVPETIRKIADAILYEGYLLYPYRLSALKNRLRWMFGVIYPEAYSRSQSGTESSFMQTECLVAGTPQVELEWSVRFLQLLRDDVVEREVCGGTILSDLLDRPYAVPFSMPTGALNGSVITSAVRLTSGVYKLTVRIENESAADRNAERGDALARSMISTSFVVGARHGEFVSSLEPAENVAAFAAECHNVGAWPVLVGTPGGRQWMLSSPIILYDYPQVAPESAGDLFDGTEIDELLTLRIRTMTDREKGALRADARARSLLERAESLAPDRLSRLHGTMRPTQTQAMRPGDRVRLRPDAGGDVLDLVLAGKTAIVQALDVDFEGRMHVAVTVEDDPGFDFGTQGRPGHRFYFRPEELERIESGPAEGAS
jgi:hypothetical protein